MKPNMSPQTRKPCDCDPSGNERSAYNGFKYRVLQQVNMPIRGGFGSTILKIYPGWVSGPFAGLSRVTPCLPSELPVTPGAA